MRHQIRSNGVKRATLDDFERAYTQLRESNFLKLDQKMLREQEEQAEREMAVAFKNRHIPTEEDRYSMSLADLRRLEDGEIKKLNQRIGEEGGYY
jgi:hypothetical protein